MTSRTSARTLSTNRCIAMLHWSLRFDESRLGDWLIDFYAVTFGPFSIVRNSDDNRFHCLGVTGKIFWTVLVTAFKFAPIYGYLAAFMDAVCGKLLLRTPINECQIPPNLCNSTLFIPSTTHPTAPHSPTITHQTLFLCLSRSLSFSLVLSLSIRRYLSLLDLGRTTELRQPIWSYGLEQILRSQIFSLHC